MNGAYITLTLPSGHIEKLTPDQWRSIRGAANRQAPGSGRVLGRKSERCSCGAFTLYNARKRFHICGDV